MANAFHRDLAVGEIVVVKQSVLLPEYGALESRLVEVTGGFGMSRDTIGRKIFVKFLCDGETSMYDATTEIDVKETGEYQSKNK